MEALAACQHVSDWDSPDFRYRVLGRIGEGGDLSCRGYFLAGGGVWQDWCRNVAKIECAVQGLSELRLGITGLHASRRNTMY